MWTVDEARDQGSIRTDPVGAARGAAGDAVGAARKRAGAARDAASAAAHRFAERPRLRGVSHQWAFFVSVLAGAALVVAAQTPRATIAMAIYAFSLSALLGTSALYHRVTWQPGSRRWMRRLDHTMIFVLIAGTYTPFALLVMHGTLAEVILISVWALAAAGAVFNLLWWDAPKWVTSIVYLSTGWVAIAALPQLWEEIGPVGVGLIALGGALYTAGAVVYARRRPDPRPEVFGYHEIFHLLVIVAAAVQFAAVAIYALPAG